MKIITLALIAVCFAAVVSAQESDSYPLRKPKKCDAPPGILYKTSENDQKQMVLDIVRSWNADTGCYAEKQSRVIDFVNKYVSKDVVMRWNSIGSTVCKMLKKEKAYLPKDCRCTCGDCTCKGRDALITLIKNDIRSMPDAKVSVYSMANNGARLFVQSEISGNHLGSWCDNDACPPTGHYLHWTGTAIYTFSNGRISSIEKMQDTGGLMYAALPKLKSDFRTGQSIVNFNKLVNHQDYSVIDKFFADKVSVRCPFTKLKADTMLSHQQLKDHQKKLHTAMPDLYCQVEDAFSTSTDTFLKSRCYGTNTGRLWNGGRATNKRVFFHIHSHTSVDPSTQKVTSRHTYLDMENLQKQLAPAMEEQ